MNVYNAVAPLSSLLALAEIDLAETANLLAQGLDQLKQAQAAEQQCQSHLVSLREIHERQSRPGHSLNIAAMALLARQAQSGLQAQRNANEATSQAKDAVIEVQQTWHAVQRRQETLQHALRDAHQALDHERERRAAIDREDLFLGRRYVMKGFA
jgi:hypothetical protein